MNGIAALGMVMDYWKSRDSTAKDPSSEQILAVAKATGLTKRGGIWEKDQPKLAQQFGYAAELKAGATMDDLRRSIDAGVPPLVTFSVDGAGNPKKGFDRGHYAVVKGYFAKEGKEYVVASHGWPSAGTKVWDAKQFEESWKIYGDGTPPKGAKMITIHPQSHPAAAPANKG